MMTLDLKQDLRRIFNPTQWHWTEMHLLREAIVAETIRSYCGRIEIQPMYYRWCAEHLRASGIITSSTFPDVVLLHYVFLSQRPRTFWSFLVTRTFVPSQRWTFNKNVMGTYTWWELHCEHTELDEEANVPQRTLHQGSETSSRLIEQHLSRSVRWWKQYPAARRQPHAQGY